MYYILYAVHLLPYSRQVSTTNVAVTRTFDARLDLTCESVDACTSAEIWRLRDDLVDRWPHEGWGNCFETRRMCLYLDC